MKRLVPVLAVFSAILIVTECSAESSDSEKGKRRSLAARKNGGDRARPGQGDPQAMVARLMQQFDKDGDKKLDGRELAALLTSMRERRGGGGRPGAGPGRPGEGRPGAGRPGAGRPGEGRPGNRDGRKPPQADRKRRPPVEATPGGDRPRRPNRD